jgi:hypothetical protein
VDKKICTKTAAIVLFVHGFIEVVGIIMVFSPEKFIPSGFQEKSLFWAVLSAIYGLSRLVAGYEIWSMKKWGIVFGLALSVITMVVAPLIYPFGIMDLLLAVVVLICLLYVWFGNEKVVKS